MCTVGWTDSDDEKSRNRFRETQLYLFVLNSDEVLFLERETYAKKGERDINDEREEKEGRKDFITTPLTFSFQSWFKISNSLQSRIY